MKDDRRYETYEMRAAYDQRFRREPKRPKRLPICYCGKTVLTPGVTCPRRCEKNR